MLDGRFDISLVCGADASFFFLSDKRI